MPAAGAALPTSDTISWVGSRARPSLDFPLGCRLPCRSQAATLPRLPMPKAPGPAGGPATLHEGPPGRRRRGAWEQGRGAGALVVVVPPGCHPSLPHQCRGGWPLSGDPWNEPKHLLWKHKFVAKITSFSSKKLGRELFCMNTERVTTEQEQSSVDAQYKKRKSFVLFLYIRQGRPVQK